MVNHSATHIVDVDIHKSLSVVVFALVGSVDQHLFPCGPGVDAEKISRRRLARQWCNDAVRDMPVNIYKTETGMQFTNYTFPILTVKPIHDSAF